MFAVQLQAAVIYVDSAAVAGANNGTSWTNAFRRLQPAINAAAAGDTLWVAKGTYYPGNPGQPTSSFVPKNNVGILGGFSGLLGVQETASSQRNHLVNITKLSGDLDQSNTHSLNDSYHIINCSAVDSSAYFEGFSIVMGNAVGSGANLLGGAVFGFNGGSKFKNCTFDNNFAQSRGGACYITGKYTFDNCIFRNNVCADQGGALDLENQPDFIRVRNCVFVNNSATNVGGAIFTIVINMRIENCTFLGNSSPSGACIRNQSNAAMQVTNCIFWGNTGPVFTGTVATVRKCIVQGGFAGGVGIINQDPMYKDALGRIFACSPAVDAGDTLSHITKDLDGIARPFDGDVNGVAKWDLGAFEVNIPRAFPSTNSIVGDGTPCLRSQQVLYHVGTDNSPANSYLWTLAAGGSISGLNNNDSVRVNWGNTLGSYTLSVRETNNLTGCSTTNTRTIVPDSLPLVNLSPNGNDSICLGDSLLITGSGIGNSRQWYRNGSMVAGQTTNQVQAKLAGYWNMVLTDGNACSDSASTALRLYLRPLPVVNLSTNIGPEICQNDLVTITGTAGQSHQWYMNGLAIGGATNNSYVTGAAGSYNMLQTDVHGCRDSAASAVEVLVNALPVVNLNPAGRDTICIGDSLAIDALAGGITGYQWLLNGSPIPSSNVGTWQANVTGNYNVIATDTNACSDSAAVSHIVISDDFVAPVASCQSHTLYLDATGNALLLPAMVDNSSSDNCRIDSFGLSQQAFNCSHLGSNNILLIPIDPANNRDTCTALVTVLDTLVPAVVCANANVYLDNSGQLQLAPSVVGGASSDNCSITIESISPNSFVCADTGQHVVTYTATDQSGNISSCTATITLADSTAPNALCRDTLVYLDGLGQASISPSSVENGSLDNCGISAFSLNQSNFTCSDVPGLFVTLTVTDISGNMSSCQAYVRVVDSVAPVALCRDTTIYIDNSGLSSLVPTSLDNGSSDNCFIDSMWLSQMQFTCLDTGANFVTLSIADADTNISTCISIVTVLDTIPPQAVCSDTTFYLNASGTAVVDPLVFGINSFDNCTFFDTTYVNVGPFTCVDTGQHSVTLYVVDIDLRIDSCTGIVTILDTLAPVMSCQNISPILNPSGLVSITAAMVDGGSADNCSIDTLFLDVYDFNCGDVGPNTVTLTAVDIYGNSASCNATVTVQDTVSPQALCQNITVYLNGTGQVSITVPDVNNGSSDNCQIDTMYLSQYDFVCSQVGANTVVLSVQDGFGNLSQCNATVTALDTIKPNALCSNLNVYLDQNGQVSITALDVDGGSTDNCSIAQRTLSQSSFNCGQLGPNAVLLTVQDPSANQDTCSSTVTVFDTLAPVAICVDTTLYLNASGNLTVAITDVTNSILDNCGSFNSVLSQSTFDCGDLGANLLSATFSDPQGNTSTCSINLLVLDSIAPNALCSNDTIYLNGAGTASLSVGQVDNNSTDACGIASYALSQTSFNCLEIGLNTVTLQVTDSSSNTGQCTSSIWVLDTIAPVIACSTATVQLDSNGQYILLPAVLDAGSSDVCGIDTSYGLPAIFNCGNIGPNTVTLFVADPSGNLDSCQVVLTIEDNIAPVAICDSVILQLDSSGTAILTPTILGGGSFDNCAIDTSFVSQTLFDCSYAGSWTQVVLSLEDPSGNMSTCIGNVTVGDTTGTSIVQLDLGADTTACNGATITFDAGAGMGAYIWSTGATSQTITVSAAGSYSVTVTSLQGCSGSDTVQVATFNTPPMNLRTESGEEVVCVNDSLLLLVDPVFSQYLWSTGATTPTVQVTTGGNYTISVTDANGCSVLENIYINFVPFPAPNPIITPPGPLGMCENTSLVLNAGAGYYAYLWSTGQTSQSITAFIPGNYNVQVWNGFGCHSTSAPTVINSLTSPYPDIQRNLDTLFTTTVANSYQWYLGGVPILGATQAQYLATLNGSYTVRAYYANGCNQISSVLPFIVGAVDPIADLKAITVAPNPSNGRFELNPLAPIRKSLNVRVVDVYGKELWRANWQGMLGSKEVDLTGLSAGVYLLEMTSPDGKFVQRLVIE